MEKKYCTHIIRINVKLKKFCEINIEKTKIRIVKIDANVESRIVTFTYRLVLVRMLV